jgi:ferric-dicitrate binding protein FerR (iron transport regulator)
MWTAGAALAAAAIVMLVVRVKPTRQPAVAPLGAATATVERVEGKLRRESDRAAVSARLSPGETLHAGEWVQTDRAGRAALRLINGTSIRIDAGARLQLVSTKSIELASGGIYLDVAERGERIEVRTPFGSARDIGTQFEVRVANHELRLRVRTGRVELRTAARTIDAAAQTELIVGATSVTSKHISASGPAWEWAAALGPTLAIEGRSLASFLEQLCREQGWRLHYDDAALAIDASGIILHGSVEGLQPRAALSVALTTSGLTHQFQGEELFIHRPPNRR